MIQSSNTLKLLKETSKFNLAKVISIFIVSLKVFICNMRVSWSRALSEKTSINTVSWALIYNINIYVRFSFELYSNPPKRL